jgi:RecJ-like exonuclease
MMAENKGMPLDKQGIPILTDIVQNGKAARHSAPVKEVRMEGMSTTEIIDTLLESESFQQQLDKLADVLTRNTRRQIENMLRPVIEQAIKKDLDHSGSEAYEDIRQRLETALPDLISRTKREESGKP